MSWRSTRAGILLIRGGSLAASMSRYLIDPQRSHAEHRAAGLTPKLTQLHGDWWMVTAGKVAQQ